MFCFNQRKYFLTPVSEIKPSNCGKESLAPKDSRERWKSKIFARSKIAFQTEPPKHRSSAKNSRRFKTSGKLPRSPLHGRRVSNQFKLFAQRTGCHRDGILQPRVSQTGTIYTTYMCIPIFVVKCVHVCLS